MKNIWEILELAETKDLSQIKQAYAKKIKTCKPEVDTKGFQELRAAYELALKHAAGIQINQNLGDDASSNLHQPSENEPEQLAFSVLDKLDQNEEEAKKMLDELKEKQTFDNIEFSDRFQFTLAANLLKNPYNRLFFMIHAADLFNWFERLKENGDRFFKLTLESLLKLSEPARFVRYLYFLSQTKNKLAAKKENLDWNECRAAKLIIFNDIKVWNFWLIKMFFPKTFRAADQMYQKIDSQYPQVLYLGISMRSFYCWFNDKHSSLFARIWNSLRRFFYIIFIFGIVASVILSAVQDQQSQGNVAHYSSTHAKPHLPIVLNKFDYQDAQSILNDKTVSSKKKLEIKPMRDYSVPQINPSYIQLDSLVKTNKINVNNIIKVEFAKQIASRNNVIGKINNPIYLDIKLRDYGLTLNSDESLTPFLVFNVSATRDGVTLFDNEVFKYDGIYSQTTAWNNVKWKEINENPNYYLTLMWNDATNNVIEQILYKIDSH